MLQAYVDFGVGETNVYNLMFTWSVPKYEDYVGTELEKTANQELTILLKVSTLFMQAAAHVVNACEAEAGSDDANHCG